MANKKRLKIAQQSESNNVRTLSVIQSEIDNKHEACDIDESYWALCKEYNVLSGRKDYFESPEEKHKNENDENDEKINVTCKCNILLVSPIESDVNIDMSEETYKDLVMFCENKNITVPTSPLLMSIWRKELKDAQDAQNFTDEIFVMARNYNIAAGHKIYAESIEEAAIKDVAVAAKDVKKTKTTEPGAEIKRSRKIDTSNNTNVLLCIMNLGYYNKYFVKTSKKAYFAAAIQSHRHEIKNIDNTISYYQKMYAPKGKENEILSLIKDTISNDARAISKTEWLYEPAESESQLSLEFA